MIEDINNLLTQIKTDKPLLLNITNVVTMDFVANGLLSVGASPVMSQTALELEELIAYAAAVIINIGTLDEKFIQLCRSACQYANQQQKPIIFDPVGAGATHYRTQACHDLLRDYQITTIRGNAGEILALTGEMGATKGVDSMTDSQQVVEHAKTLAKKYVATVVVSGKTDVVVTEDQLAFLECGSPIMPMVTGMGCLLTAMVGAFQAVEKNTFQAAKLATYFYGKCGEIAAEQATGPGTFKVKFLDRLSMML